MMRMLRAMFGACAGLMLLASPAAAQERLTSEDVAAAFVEAVGLCIDAIGVGSVAALPENARAQVGESSPEARAFLRAAEGRPVWDVLSGQGIVFISEPEAARCNVSAYGPRVRPVFDTVAGVVTGPRYNLAEIDAPQTPEAIVRIFRSDAVGVILDGGEPGMRGRTFRFPMLLAYVSGAPAAGAEQ